jgi:hypothetical protein
MNEWIYDPYSPDFSESFILPFNDSAVYLGSTPDNAELALSNAIYEISKLYQNDGFNNPQLLTEANFGHLTFRTKISGDLAGFHLPGLKWRPNEHFDRERWDAITEDTPGGIEIQHEIDWFLDLICRIANSLLPKFISENSTLRIDLDPSSLIEGNGCLGINLHIKNKRFPIPFRELSGGTRRWVSNIIQLSVSFVCRLGHMFFQETADSMTQFRNLTEGTFIINDARLKPLSNCIICIDEPEAHLHPLAIKSVLELIHKLEDLGATLIVATHNIQVFDHSAELVGETQRFVSVAGGEDDFRSFGRDASQMHYQAQRELGLTDGELYLLTKKVIVVEGKQDANFLEGYFGDELRKSGAQLVPLYGLDNIGGRRQKWNLAIELLEKLGVPIAGVLLDNVARGENELRARLRNTRTVFLDRPDIWMYIDVDVFNSWLKKRNSSETLTSWTDDFNEAKNDPSLSHLTSDVSKFKEFVQRKYRFRNGAKFTQKLNEFGKIQRRHEIIEAELVDKFMNLLRD